VDPRAGLDVCEKMNQTRSNYEINGILERKTTEIMQHTNIQYGDLLNKYLKCSVWRLAVRYHPYMGGSAPKGRYILTLSPYLRAGLPSGLSRQIPVCTAPPPYSAHVFFLYLIARTIFGKDYKT
jgi:hypothetical protein